MRLCFAFALIALLSAGCVRRAPPNSVASVAIEPRTDDEADWRDLALPEDAALITALTAEWAVALGEARPRFAKAIAAEGALLDADAALDRPEPSPGRYRCRTVRLGVATGAKRDTARPLPFTRFRPFYCFVASEGPLLAFTKGTGSQRPGGWLWRDTPKRLVFLGGIAERARDPAPAYRAGSRANVAGVLERIGEFRWRLVLLANTGARLEVIELVPDTPPPTEPVQ